MVADSFDGQSLPGVGLWGFAARTWENLVEAFQDFSVQRNFRGTQGWTPIALVPQLFEGLPSLVPGAIPVHVVHLVKIDVVGLESFEAAFAVLADLYAERLRPSVLGSARLALRLTGLNTLVARTTASLRPPPWANQRPRISSVSPCSPLQP